MTLEENCSTQRLSKSLRESPVDYKAPLTWSYTVLSAYRQSTPLYSKVLLYLDSIRLPVNSSHGQLVTRSTRHMVNSSQRGGQLVTSKQTS